MKWKEVSKFIKAYKDYVNQVSDFEEVQSCLSKELRYNGIKLALDESSESRKEHISIIFNGKTMTLQSWCNNRIEQKFNDIGTQLIHLSFVLEDEEILKKLRIILKKVGSKP